MINVESGDADFERLRKRLRRGEGLPLCNVDQLEALHDDPDHDRQLRVEYDRFAARRVRT